MDLVGSWSYHKHWSFALLRTLIPGALLGIFVGWLCSDASLRIRWS
jgi:uncharacterized protein